MVGTSVSALFLFAIAMINIVVLRAVYRLFKRVRRGEAMPKSSWMSSLRNAACSAGCSAITFRLISRSWQMYPLGFLFGLGFDTATEIGLLGISAAEAAKGLPIWSILVFPALVYRGHVARRHQRRRADGRRLWLGIRQPGPQALLQSDDHRHLRGRRPAVGAIETCGLIAEKFGVKWRHYGRSRRSPRIILAR